MPTQSEPERPRVAVVAVHGVGDQPPRGTVFAIGNLLLNLSGKTGVIYTPFAERELRVATRRVAVEAASAPSAPRLGWWARLRQPIQAPFNERSGHVRARLKAGAAGAASHDFMFMREQLREYEDEGPDAAYESLCLEGARLDAQNQPDADVHLFEMYWADLSRLGAGWLRVFSELYQLLFHLGSLGRLTLDFARLEQSESRPWRWLGQVHAGAVWLLTLPIPILNLYLLPVVLVAAPGNIPQRLQPFVAWGLPLLAVVIVAGWLLLRAPKATLLVWAVTPLIAVALAASIYRAWGLHLSLGRCDIALALEWCVLAAALVWWLIRAYDERRPGAGLFSLGVGEAVLIFFVMLLLSVPPTHAGITSAAMVTLDLLYWALSISWLAFDLLAVVTLALALWALAAARFAERARQAVGTALLSLALPAGLFVVVTVTLWEGLYLAAVRLLPAVSYLPLIPTSFTPGPMTAPQFVQALINASGTPLFAAGLLLMALAGLLAIWSLAPVVWAEIFPAKGEDEASRRLGEWLSKGLWLICWAGGLLYFVVAFLFPAGFLQSLPPPAPPYLPPSAETGRLLQVLGTVLVTSTATLFVARGRLEKLALGFRPLLDAVLDVDSWLREHPRRANPRARICARYASLLRYLCNWTDPRDYGKYAAIVIVAHSQGSVITADLLRFLRTEREQQLQAGNPDWESALSWLGADLPVYFFTVGSPLRQLYSSRFPDLYRWARYMPDPGAPPENWAAWKEGDIIPEQRAPDPDELGAAVWVNAYRSGDYIGRYLWRPHACDYRWWRPAPTPDERPWDPTMVRPQNVSQDTSHSRHEFCLGAGAHNHYMDRTAPAVAVELDRLIFAASRHGFAARLEALAAAVMTQGHARRAARLLGATAALREAIGAPVRPPVGSGADKAQAAARLALGDVAFAAAWAEGQQLLARRAAPSHW